MTAMRRFKILLSLGCVIALAGAALAVIPSSWTLYWIGWGVMSVGILLVVVAAESAP